MKTFLSQSIWREIKLLETDLSLVNFPSLGSQQISKFIGRKVENLMTWLRQSFESFAFCVSSNRSNEVSSSSFHFY